MKPRIAPWSEGSPLYVFDPKLATKIGLEASIIVQRVHYWVTVYKDCPKHRLEGHTWVWNPIERSSSSTNSWEENFPFMSVRTVRRNFKALEDKGILVSKKMKKSKRDHTKWYRLDYSRISDILETDPAKLATSTSGQIGQFDPAKLAGSINTKNTVQNNTQLEYLKERKKIPCVRTRTQENFEEDILEEIYLCFLSQFPSHLDFPQGKRLLFDLLMKEQAIWWKSRGGIGQCSKNIVQHYKDWFTSRYSSGKSHAEYDLYFYTLCLVFGFEENRPDSTKEKSIQSSRLIKLFDALHTNGLDINDYERYISWMCKNSKFKFISVDSISMPSVISNYISRLSNGSLDPEAMPL